MNKSFLGSAWGLLLHVSGQTSVRQYFQMKKKKSIIITDISKKELIIKKKKITTLLVKAIMIPQPFRVSI